MIREHIEIIKKLMSSSEEAGIPLWLESGWAIDARLGRVTREHEDIDIAFPSERQRDYVRLAESLGFGNYEQMDYGFLMSMEKVLLDSEACVCVDGEYTFEGFPKGSCPLEEEGQIDDSRVRCVSWEAVYFEFLGYMDLVPRAKWREKDFAGLRIVRAHVTPSRQRELRKRYSDYRARRGTAGA